MDRPITLSRAKFPVLKNNSMIFWGLTVPMIIVTMLYRSGDFDSLPCNNDLVSNTKRNFIHIDTNHLLANLSVFYILSSELEDGISMYQYIVLILVILGLIVVLDTVYLNINDDANCSIGFSGILYGLLAWNILSRRKLTKESILSIVILVIQPSVSSSKVSLSGHAIGALAGLITYMGHGFIKK